ncbi:hypothetical protein J4G37_10920 [Microvirga sp. 3-52]|nr:hypothetical protein [Microvirga sp. 3-52]
MIEFEGADALEAEDVVDAEDVGTATGTLCDDAEPIFMTKPHGCPTSNNHCAVAMNTVRGVMPWIMILR